MDTKTPENGSVALWNEIDNFFATPPPSTSHRTPAPPSTPTKTSTPTTTTTPTSKKPTKKTVETKSKKRKGATTTTKKVPSQPITPTIPTNTTRTTPITPTTPVLSAIDRALQQGNGNRMAENRIQNDLNLLPDEEWFDIPEPDPNNLFTLEIAIIPPEGMWKGCRYKFRCNLPHDYPFSPPRLHCETLIYHPNIDLSGNVCISILKDDGKTTGWSVQRSLSDILFGLLALFSEPNVGDPLNNEAANLLAKSPEEFKKLVNRTLKGESVSVNNENRKFEKLL